MTEWRASKWGDEISLEYGKAIRGYNEQAGAVRVFGTNGAIGWTHEPLAVGPGVILGRKGAYRGVRYSRDPFFVIDTAYYVVPKSPLNMRWIYYAMISHELGKIDDGSPIPSTTRAAVYPRELYVPPRREQDAIANILGSLDDKIEQNKRSGQALEALASATFKAWFVDFEPVKAKAAGADAFPGMPSEAFAEVPDSFLESPLGRVPHGWTTRRLADLLTLHYGKSLAKPKRQAGEFPVYGSGGIDGTHNQSLVNGPGIVVGRKGSVGTIYWIDTGFFPIDTTYFVQQKSHLRLPYLYELLKTLGLESMNTDAAVPGLNRENAYRLEVVEPSITVARFFDEFAAPMRELCRHLALESAKLTSLREYLLPRLLSGQVRVREAEAVTEGVA